MRASWRTGSSRMTRMKKLACSVSLILVGAAPVAANPNKVDAPKSLRMRLRPRPHVAQAAPDPAQPAPADQPAPPPADQPAPAPMAEPAPTPAQTPEQPNVSGTPNLSDEELAKLAEQEAKTEVITVTG